MSNKYLLPLIIAISILFTGAVALIQSRNSNNKVAIVSSSSVVMTQSSVVSSSNSKESISTVSSKISDYPKAFSGTIGTSEVLINIISDFNAEYIYKGVSENIIGVKNQSDSSTYKFQEAANIYFSFDKKTFTGQWTDGKNTYPIKFSRIDSVNLQNVIESNKQEKNLNKAKVITFDSITQTSLKLETTNEITSISVGKCDLQTKFNMGPCEILDQNLKAIVKINSLSGFPILTTRTAETQKIITIVRAYGACSLNEYEFSFKTYYLTIIKNLVSPGCSDNSVIKEIEKYEDQYYKLNYPQN